MLSKYNKELKSTRVLNNYSRLTFLFLINNPGWVQHLYKTRVANRGSVPSIEFTIECKFKVSSQKECQVNFRTPRWICLRENCLFIRSCHIKTQIKQIIGIFGEENKNRVKVDVKSNSWPG